MLAAQEVRRSSEAPLSKRTMAMAVSSTSNLAGSHGAQIDTTSERLPKAA